MPKGSVEVFSNAYEDEDATRTLQLVGMLKAVTIIEKFFELKSVTFHVPPKSPNSYLSNL